MDNERDYLTRKEFREFRDNHFHALELKVAELVGGNRVQLAFLIAIMGLVAAVLVIALV